ncbi:MAG: zinc-ribbon domain-containing protein, partial [Candidatus Thorarchaeota archaeon]
GNELIIDLTSGGNMRFKFKQKRVIPSIMANISSAQNEGKCPYCGAGNSPGANACSKCNAPLAGGGGGHDEGHSESITISTGGAGGYCTNCGKPYPAGAKFCGGCGRKV